MSSRLMSMVGLLIVSVMPGIVRGDDWPQWMGPKRDGVWRETGIARKLPEGELKPLWRKSIAGGYAGPSVADGRVYVIDYLVEKGTPKNDPGGRPELQGQERLHCFDAKTGAELWTHAYPCAYSISYPAGPRATPTVTGGKVYTVGAEGDLYCLDAAKGKVIWHKNFKKDYKAETPIWGFCSHPLVDGETLYTIAGGEGSVAIAFHKDTGEEKWKALSAREPGYSSPHLIEAGGTRQLLIFHAEAINSLDPATGKVYWSVPIRPNYGMAIMSPVKHGDFLFTAAVDNVGVMLKLDQDHPAAKVAWRGDKTRALYTVCASPIVEEDGTMYGVDRAGQLRGVVFESGKRLWETLAATTGKRPANSGTAFLVKNADRYFLFSETGDLIVAELTPQAYKEISRKKLLEPTGEAFGRPVVWSHPAYAEKCIYARNDKEIVCVSLAE